MLAGEKGTFTPVASLTEAAVGMKRRTGSVTRQCCFSPGSPGTTRCSSVHPDQIVILQKHGLQFASRTRHPVCNKGVLFTNAVKVQQDQVGAETAAVADSLLRKRTFAHVGRYGQVTSKHAMWRFRNQAFKTPFGHLAPALLTFSQHVQPRAHARPRHVYVQRKVHQKQA